MLTLPPAPERAALLGALESLVADAGYFQLMHPPVAPERFSSVLASRGARHLASAVFEAAGMPEPEVVIMGGSGAATAFRTQGKAIVRMGAELPAGIAVASIIRAAAATWRQASDMRPVACDEDEIATSVYLSLGAAEARAARDIGERARASALVFLLAAQSLARNDAPRTAAVARELGEPLDGLYEDALRLLALRGEELRARFRVDEARLPFERAATQLLGSPPSEDPDRQPSAIAVASLEEANGRLAKQPCPCGGRWRIAEERAGAGASTVRFTIVCRVCFQWRSVLWQLPTGADA
jgi:hypothetical protein